MAKKAPSKKQPASPAPQTTPPVTLYTLTFDAIEAGLLKSEIAIYQELGQQVANFGTPEAKLKFLHGDRKYLRRVFAAGRFQDFHFEKMEANDSWRWTMKVTFEEEMK